MVAETNKKVKTVKKMKKKIHGGLGLSPDVEEEALTIEQYLTTIKNNPTKYPESDPVIKTLLDTIAKFKTGYSKGSEMYTEHRGDKTELNNMKETDKILKNQFPEALRKRDLIAQTPSNRVRHLEEFNKLAQKKLENDTKISKLESTTGQVSKILETTENYLKNLFINQIDPTFKGYRVPFRTPVLESIPFKSNDGKIAQLKQADDFFEKVIVAFNSAKKWNLSEQKWDNLQDSKIIQNRQNLCANMQRDLYDGFKIIQKIYTV
jgi:hypothetical protein